METYRKYKGYIIKRDNNSHYAKWRVYNKEIYINGYRTRQEARRAIDKFSRNDGMFI